MISKNNYNLRWGNIFYYDEHCPSGLRRVSSGEVAGTKQYRKNGDPSKWMVKYKNKNYSVAKIVYVLVNGYVPNDLIIDHIDRNPFNNVISNLRPVSESLNLKNKNHHTNNSSGFMGVSTRIAEGIKYYTATWINPLSGKQEGKSFSTKKLGDFLAKMKATIYRFHKIKSLSGYGDQHFNNLEMSDVKLLEEAADEIETLRKNNELQKNL